MYSCRGLGLSGGELFCGRQVFQAGEDRHSKFASPVHLAEGACAVSPPIDQDNRITPLHQCQGAVEEELVLPGQVIIEVRGVGVRAEREPAEAGGGDGDRPGHSNVLGDQFASCGAVGPSHIYDRYFLFGGHTNFLAGPCPGGGVGELGGCEVCFDNSLSGQRRYCVARHVHGQPVVVRSQGIGRE